ncbi:MAG: hypothetical protein QOH76_1067 [Thermoleophilaceae bacterium]|jgi:hypothetical protein|nr:hypothetical protein [Thermoleophilaceae bacterium]
MALARVFYTGNGTTPVDSGLPHVGTAPSSGTSTTATARRT